MSELDKYGKHDPLAQHSSYAKKSKITVADTDAWIAKYGNGMDRIKKPNNTKAVNVWADYSKVSTVTLIYRHLNAHGEIVPSDIQDVSCRRSVHGQCLKMARSGEIVELKEKRAVYIPALNMNQKFLVSVFKRA